MEISEKAEQLKQVIDVHRDKLMNNLSSVKQTRTKEIDSLREEIGRRLLSVESYKKYVVFAIDTSPINAVWTGYSPVYYA